MSAEVPAPVDAAGGAPPSVDVEQVLVALRSTKTESSRWSLLSIVVLGVVLLTAGGSTSDAVLWVSALVVNEAGHLLAMHAVRWPAPAALVFPVPARFLPT